MFRQNGGVVCFASLLFLSKLVALFQITDLAVRVLCTIDLTLLDVADANVGGLRTASVHVAVMSFVVVNSFHLFSSTNLANWGYPCGSAAVKRLALAHDLAEAIVHLAPKPSIGIALGQTALVIATMYGAGDKRERNSPF